MAQFSLGNIFVAIAGLAAGLAIWRLPKGDWTDVPIFILSLYFAASLGRAALRTRRFIVAHPALSQEQRWGECFKAIGMLGLATLLCGCWGLRYLAADGLILNPPDRMGIDYVIREKLPNDLAVLTMLAAMGVSGGFERRAATVLRRQYFNSSIAIVGIAMVVVAYWIDRMLIPYLIYLAVSGIARAQPARLLAPDRNIRDAVWNQQFAVVTSIAALVVVLNLVIIWAIVRGWNQRRRRSSLQLLFALSLAAQVGCVAWIYSKGLWHLSPEMAESIHAPSPDSFGIAVAIVFVATAAFVWRASANILQAEQTLVARPPDFHESWVAGLLLGLVGILALVNIEIGDIKRMLSNPFSPGFTGFNWQSVVYGRLLFPAQLIYWAACIGGFMLAWRRFRRPSSSVASTVIHFQPGKFCFLAVSIACVIILSAPIIEALAFSFWLVGLPKNF